MAGLITALARGWRKVGFIQLMSGGPVSAWCFRPGDTQDAGPDLWVLGNAWETTRGSGVLKVGAWGENRVMDPTTCVLSAPSKRGVGPWWVMPKVLFRQRREAVINRGEV